MEDPLLFVYGSLGVPYGLLETDEARRRSAAAQLLRRTPGLRNILEVEEDHKYPFTDELWHELELILDVNEAVIGCVAEALGEGELDALLGGFPSPERARPWDSFETLLERISLRVGPPPNWAETVNTVEDALNRAEHESTVLPEGHDAGPWLKLILNVLVVALTAWCQRAGWPVDTGGTH